MLNTRSIETVDKARYRSVLRRPRYEDYGFSRIPWTIEDLLIGPSRENPGGNGSVEPRGRCLPTDTLPGCGPGDVDRVLLLFIDSFGWRHVERYLEQYPLLRRFEAEGVISKVTSMFPSTTTAHVTGIHTGMTPIESGLYEWFQYHEAYDAMIAPLLFSLAGEKRRDGLLALGEDPSGLFRGETTHERLVKAGAASFYVTPSAFTPSPYNDQVCRGATGMPYESLDEGLDTVKALLERPVTGPEYVHFYFGDVDSTSHWKGLHSEEMEAAVGAIMAGLEKLVTELAPETPGRTLILLTADHGMIETPAESTVYLNQLWPEVTERLVFLRGEPLVPAGSPRDFFLHVTPDARDDTVTELRRRLDGVAHVESTDELITEGFFGPGDSSANFSGRAGNVVILPHAGESVWWYEQDRFVNVHEAHHGGLSPLEMDIPVAAMLV